MRGFSQRVLRLAHVLPAVFPVDFGHNQPLPVILQSDFIRELMTQLHPLHAWSWTERKGGER